MNIEKEITTFEDLEDLISSSLKHKLENHLGLWYFAKNRSKFEGWLKTELCEILAQGNEEANIKIEELVERGEKKYYKIDLVFNDEFAIELKTINTYYEKDHPDIIKKYRPLDLNCKHLKKDIDKLKELKQLKPEYKYKILIFIVFPLTNFNCKDWCKRLEDINIRVDKPETFTFRDKIPGVLYVSEIK